MGTYNQMDSFSVFILQSLATDATDEGGVHHDLPFALPGPLVQMKGGLRAIRPPALAATEGLHCEK